MVVLKILPIAARIIVLGIVVSPVQTFVFGLVVTIAFRASRSGSRGKTKSGRRNLLICQKNTPYR
jgi:hypothetical protein